MIIDSHHHLWQADLGWLHDSAELEPLRRDYTVTELRENIRQAGVDRTVLVEADRGDIGETAWFLDLADSYPEIVGVVGWIDLEDPDFDDIVQQYQRHPAAQYLVGLRAQVQNRPDPDYFDSPHVQRGLRSIGQKGLNFDLIVRCDQLMSIARTASLVPEVTFVLDHLGKPPISAGRQGWDMWYAGMSALAASPNVVAKLSGLVTQADWTHWTVADLQPYIDVAIDLFGPSRLMFGSDWPVCELAATYTQVVEATAAALAGQTEEIFCRTAVRTYGLDV